MTKRHLSLIQYIGGKGAIWRFIVKNLPPGTVYVEPFGGGAAVLLNKDPHPIEVYNDIDDDLINLFRAIQDEKRFEKLKRRLRWTLYSYSEFCRALKILKESDDLDDRAWAFYVVKNQGYSGKAKSPGEWSRSFVPSRGMSTPNSRWITHYNNLDLIRERFMRVMIDGRDALEVISYWDTNDTVFYIDPPYPHSVRGKNNYYKYEMTDEQHIKLVELLLSIKGSFSVSTYRNDIYDELLSRKGVYIAERDVVAYSKHYGRTFGKKS